MPLVIDSESGLVIVDKPLQAPGMCIATLQTEDYKGFIDTGNVPAVMDPHIYISVSWIGEVARKLGWTETSEIEALRSENDALLEKLINAERALGAIEALKQAGYTADVKRGRPAQTQTEKEYAEKSEVTTS